MHTRDILFSGGSMSDEPDEKTRAHLEAMGFELINGRWQGGGFIATVKGQTIVIKRTPKPRLVVNK
jgi:hypothetical protein